MLVTRAKPESYQQQLDEKEQRILKQFANFGVASLQVFPSPPQYYRMRTEFRLWKEDDDLYYAMFEPAEPQTPIRIDHFDIASKAINQLMPILLEHLKASEILRQRIFQVEFLSTSQDEMLVTLIYHKRLDDVWEQQARQLADTLNIQIIGRSRKQKIVLDADYVTEQLTVDNKTYRYQQIENSFTQPNAAVNQHMLGWAKQRASTLGGDLLELYCGNGNFTTVLASEFDRVLATEISKTSVRSAITNFDNNAVNNVQIARMSSEELTQALNHEREFRRLKEIDLDSYQLSTVLVDPPRAGLDAGTEQLVCRFDHILYISCNPDTLAQNLSAICESHDIVDMAIFDQFPYTHHIECGVYLKKRKA